MTVERVGRVGVRRPGFHERLLAWWFLRFRYRLVEDGGWRLEVKRRGVWSFGCAFPGGDRWRCEQAARRGALASARGYQGFAKLGWQGRLRVLVGR